MTPEIKANELIEKFRPYAYAASTSLKKKLEQETVNAKACAIICVDEILLSIQDVSAIENEKWDFYQSVKSFIQKQ